MKLTYNTICDFFRDFYSDLLTCDDLTERYLYVEMSYNSEQGYYIEDSSNMSPDCLDDVPAFGYTSMYYNTKRGCIELAVIDVNIDVYIEQDFKVGEGIFYKLKRDVETPSKRKENEPQVIDCG